MIKPHCTIRVSVMFEGPQLWLCGKPLHERFCPREETREALEAERAPVQDPHVVVVHGPRSFAGPSEVI